MIMMRMTSRMTMMATTIMMTVVRNRIKTMTVAATMMRMVIDDYKKYNCQDKIASL